MSHDNKNIQFHENIAIADTAFTVRGEDEGELFENAAIALISSMANISKIRKKTKRDFQFERDKLDILLFDFLDEILLYKDSEKLLFSKFNVNIDESNGKYKLNAKIWGETVDPDRHEVSIDIKAITMHMFKVKETKSGFEARVIVDV